MTPAIVRAIRARYAEGGISQRDVGAQFGITQMLVSLIVRRRMWPDDSDAAAPVYPTLEERFWDRIEPCPASGCWLWTGGAHRDTGYGVLHSYGRQYLVHRLSYEMANGPIPAGMAVCHKCDVPACVATSHLFLGDAASNAADAKAKDRHSRGERNGGGGKLTDLAVQAIRALYAEGAKNQYELASMFGVSQSMIGQIVRGRRWAHVPQFGGGDE